MPTSRVILASGCFWGAQELFRSLPGVVSTRVGYSGDDDTPNATYRNHGDHAEALEVIYDPSIIRFQILLEFFFQIHDPTTRNRQGNDIGRSYRSAIFTTTEGQMKVAFHVIEAICESGSGWSGTGRSGWMSVVSNRV